MTIETTAVKRPALYKGEVGLFPTCEMESQDLELIAMMSQVMLTITSTRRIEALRYLWGLVWEAQQNTDYWIDKWKAMEWFKINSGFVKPGRDPDTKEWDPQRPRSLKRISDEELRLLTERVKDLICTEVLPGMTHDDLRRRMEEMLGAPKTSYVGTRDRAESRQRR